MEKKPFVTKKQTLTLQLNSNAKSVEIMLVVQELLDVNPAKEL